MSKTKHSREEDQLLDRRLENLKLKWIREHHRTEATEAAREQRDHTAFLARLIEGEDALRKERSIVRRLRLARFPVVKTLDSFQWNWPKSINRLQVQDLFRLDFIKQRANVIFMGGVGLGKTHLSTALAHEACLQGYSVLFASAIDIINTLNAAGNAGRLKYGMSNYLRPSVLVIDELGYLPIDKRGSDLLFQVISHRYERGSIILSTNKPFKKWPETFNNDSTLTSAVLDRLLHHAHVIPIQGTSFRMKDQLAD